MRRRVPFGDRSADSAPHRCACHSPNVSESRTRLPLILSVAAMGGIGVTLGVAFAPPLLHYSPLLLIALAPLGRHLILAAPVTAFVPFVVVGTLRRVVTCALSYLIGQAYGEAGLAWLRQRYPRASRVVRVVQRVFDRAGPLVVLIAPGPLMCALAGLTGMRWRLFLPLATLGQMAWVAITYQLGAALRAYLIPILAWLEENMLATTLTCVLLVLLYQLGRRGRRADPLAELQASAVAAPESTGEG